MNITIQSGRLTSDPTITHNGEYTIANYTIASERIYKKEGQPDADFIRCVAYGKTAEFVEKYFRKGTKIALSGRINTRNYESEGRTVYVTEVIADRVEFAESKNTSSTVENNYANEFVNIPEGLEEELPFN